MDKQEQKIQLQKMIFGMTLKLKRKIGMSVNIKVVNLPQKKNK